MTPQKTLDYCFRRTIVTSNPSLYGKVIHIEGELVEYVSKAESKRRARLNHHIDYTTQDNDCCEDIPEF